VVNLVVEASTKRRGTTKAANVEDHKEKCTGQGIEIRDTKGREVGSLPKKRKRRGHQGRKRGDDGGECCYFRK